MSFFKAPVLALAFRPFFLFGSLYAVLAIAYWALFLAGVVGLPPYFNAIAWHAHEMLFGFVAAILAGFLLTASKNWAKTRGVHGPGLFFLVLVWALGRIGIFASAVLPGALTAVLDLAFLPCLAVMLFQTLAKGAGKNNFFFVFWLAVLFVANLLMHLEALGITPGAARKGYLLGVDTVVVIMVMMGGRIIPLFTRNAIPGLVIPSRKGLDYLALGSVVLYLIADFIRELSPLTAALAIAAGIASFLRLLGWKSHATLGRPVLWVLHLGYAFIGVGLVVRGLSLSTVPLVVSVPLHLLTAGAMGVLILGMISRVALGHTGRPIVASRSTVVAYLFIGVAALIRFLTPLLFPSAYLTGMLIAAVFWSAGFALFALVYWPILTQPRVDQLEG